MADRYKDFLDIEIGEEYKKLLKNMYEFLVIAKYIGKGSRVLQEQQRYGKGIAYKDKLLTNGHIIDTPYEYKGKFKENGKIYEDTFEKYDEVVCGIDDKGVPATFSIKLKKLDPDIAILKIPYFIPGSRGGKPYKFSRLSKLGDSREIEVGDFIFTIRTPAMFEPLYDEGKITAKKVPDEVGNIERKKSYFLHNIDVFPGDSADPVFALYDGPELIGLTCGKIYVRLKNREELSLPYAVKINEFKRYL